MERQLWIDKDEPKWNPNIFEVQGFMALNGQPIIIWKSEPKKTAWNIDPKECNAQKEKICQFVPDVANCKKCIGFRTEGISGQFNDTDIETFFNICKLFPADKHPPFKKDFLLAYINVYPGGQHIAEAQRLYAGAGESGKKTNNSAYSLPMTTEKLYDYIFSHLVDVNQKPELRTFQKKLKEYYGSNANDGLIEKEFGKHKIKSGAIDRIVAIFKRAK